MDLISKQFNCTFLSIKMDIPLKLWEAITTDGGQHPFITRFFHNKPYFYFVAFFKCYFSVLDPNFIVKIFPWWLLPLLLWVIFSLFKKKRFLLVPFLLFPILLMEESLPLDFVIKVKIYRFYLWGLTLLGAIHFFNLRRFLWKKSARR